LRLKTKDKKKTDRSKAKGDDGWRRWHRTTKQDASERRRWRRGARSESKREKENGGRGRAAVLAVVGAGAAVAGAIGVKRLRGRSSDAEPALGDQPPPTEDATSSADGDEPEASDGDEAATGA
jgi:hypothetical protein